MGKPTLVIPYTNMGSDYIGISRKSWAEIEMVLSHDFKIKMERKA